MWSILKMWIIKDDSNGLEINNNNIAQPIVNSKRCTSNVRVLARINQLSRAQKLCFYWMWITNRIYKICNTHVHMITSSLLWVWSQYDCIVILRVVVVFFSPCLSRLSNHLFELMLNMLYCEQIFWTICLWVCTLPFERCYV